MLHVSKRLKAAEERMRINRISDCSQMTNKILIRHKEKRKGEKKTRNTFFEGENRHPAEGGSSAGVTGPKKWVSRTRMVLSSINVLR